MTPTPEMIMDALVGVAWVVVRLEAEARLNAAAARSLECLDDPDELERHAQWQNLCAAILGETRKQLLGLHAEAVSRQRGSAPS